MLVTICKSKIHRATITDACLDYVGSISIPTDLMAKANLLPYEKVQVANITNGERFETYVIEGKPGSGAIELNGAAARKGQVGDLVIIIAYGHMTPEEARGFKPAIVHVDKDNRPVEL
ncbi:MAG TPA: aspartate 1-decarboxylase [candidate division Zixibacteria bacterium]|nr:aspartate 1-decarboxylase [candidate division Zixibacteria bacterium]